LSGRACLAVLAATTGGLMTGTMATAQDLKLPRGLSIANQMEYAWLEDTGATTLENWFDARYTSGALSAGIRYLTLQPPDPSVTSGGSRFVQDFRFVEASSDQGSLRAGHYYALFGHGLALNAYEERDLRVDDKLEGLQLRGQHGDLGIHLISGSTPVGGNHVHGADVEWFHWASGLGVGGSAVRIGRDVAGTTNVQSARVSYGGGPFYAEAEGIVVDEPERFGEDGEGLFASASLGIGPLQLLAEVKSYDEIDTGVNLPPAVFREHTYTLLNRHPHVLNPDDEKGFQVEGTLTAGHHQLTGNVARTRNHDDDLETNYLDEEYGEAFLGLGEQLGLLGLDVVLAGDHQKLYEGVLPDPFTGELTVPAYVELYTGIAELRMIATDVHSFRVQFEAQHTESKFDGEYDTWFTLLEWSRSPDLTLNLVGETSNRSNDQLDEDENKQSVYGIATYHISDNHDVSVLYGRRLEGFVCVGGVCRFEPEFEGVEVRLLSRF